MGSVARFRPAPDREEWERQPQETDSAWQAFLTYREMGFRRSVRAAAEEHRKKIGGDAAPPQRYFEQLARRWGWTRRINAWERELDKERAKIAKRDVREMCERHVQLAKSVQSLAAMELNKLLVQSQSNSVPTMSAAQLVRALEIAVKLEREARDEPSSIVEQRGLVTVEEERRELRKILENPDALEIVDGLMDLMDSEPN